jgi:hypothetical protein
MVTAATAADEPVNRNVPSFFAPHAEGDVFAGQRGAGEGAPNFVHRNVNRLCT